MKTIFKIFNSLLLLSVVIFLFFACSSDSGFEQIGYYKNEQKKRIFSYYTQITDWEKIRNHASKQMNTAGSPTAVFYFNDKSNTPDVTFVAENFNEKYNKYCIAVYWKDANGKTSFTKYPFKNN